MKIVTIVPVAKPKSFTGSLFSEAEHKQAVRIGEKRVDYQTAIEAVKNSKGLYRIQDDRPAIAVELKGLKDPDDMTNQELAMEASAHGKPIRKQISRKALMKFILDLREKSVEFIVEDDDD